MPLAFSASQALQLPVKRHAAQLAAYLDDEQREEARRKAEEQVAEFCS